MEYGDAEAVFAGPHHPYTEALLSAVPSLDGTRSERIILTGEIPSPAHPPSGCVFHTRCPRRLASGVCESTEPPLAEVEPGHFMRFIVIGLVFALLISRTVRTAVLQERELDYIAAARLRDESDPHIMFVEILPNVMGPILVEFTVRLGYAIFTIASLSFLGFGIQPPTPDWGADIANSYQYLGAGYWWEVLFPALAIASLVVAINLIADSIEAVVIQ